MNWTELTEAYAAKWGETSITLCRTLKKERVPLYYRGAPLGSAVVNPEPLPIQADEFFRTWVSCPVDLPTAGETTITPKTSLFSAKTKWVVKSDLPETVTQRLTALLADAPKGMPPLALHLTPNLLSITFDGFQDEIGSFCAYSDWHPTDTEGRSLTSVAAAELVLDTMTDICRKARRVLQET